MSFSKDELLNGVKKTWLPLLDNKLLDDIIINLNKFEDDIIYPSKNNIFECFRHFELNETKLVFLGQDPYINKDEAMGLSFSVPKSNKNIPPSLRNIYKELKINRNHGDLTHWVSDSQFLLLNTSLTVLEGKSNSHAIIWKNYTNKIIQDISNQTNKIIFLLLGNYAKSKIDFIDCNKHIVITGVHPSPLSACRGFLGSNIFDKVNSEYFKLFNKNINW
jgi:uracil-DNA glycosylase